MRTVWHGVLNRAGNVSEPEAIEAIQRWTSVQLDNQEEVYYTHQIGIGNPPFAEQADLANGVMVVSLLVDSSLFIM